MIKRFLTLGDEQSQRSLRALLAWIVVTAILQGVVFVLLVPFLGAFFQGHNEQAVGWLWLLLGIGAAYGVAYWIGARFGHRAACQILNCLICRIGDRLVELPSGWFAADHSGELANATTKGVVFASAAPYAILRGILNAFITPATMLIGMIFIDWRIALTMAVAAPLLWLAYRWLGGRIQKADIADSAAAADASARVIEFGRVQPALRAAGENSIAMQLVDDALHHQHATTKHVHLVGGGGMAVSAAVVQTAVAAVIGVGTWLTLGGDLSATTLLPLLVVLVRFSEPIIHSGALGGGLQMANNTLIYVEQLLNEPTLAEPESAAQPDDWSIRFDDVTFGYGAAPVLKNLSFTAPAGQMTAIVGPSGSGKTTITRLMARFYDPEEGTVLLGGKPLPELGSEAVINAVSPVFQDVYLFDESILDNVAVGDPSATPEQVREAAVKARVDEIAERLPNGWDSRVGEGGSNLSGGERQRISIARALLKNTPVVLLDEATAALDIGNEQAISRAIAEIRDHRTLVVVAHRLQTIRQADQIIMLDGIGGIAEQGTHDELLAAGGVYARYWAERNAAAGWRLTSTAVG